jgi:hypothetical protein
MNSKCDKFKGRYTCDYFIQNGACSLPSKFMCHIFAETGHQPVEDDVPPHVGEVLKGFDTATVVKETGVTAKKSRNLMEEFFGKI